MTEKQLRNTKPGDKLIIHVEVERHDPKGYGVDLVTIHPEDGHRISSAFYAYQEAVAISVEAASLEIEPYGVCCYSGADGTFWAVEDARGGRVATFFTHAVPEAQKEAVRLRDKLNHLFNSQNRKKQK